MEKCPECGSSNIGRGKWSAWLQPVGKMFSLGSAVEVDLCTDCGLIYSMRVKSPEKFR